MIFNDFQAKIDEEYQQQKTLEKPDTENVRTDGLTSPKARKWESDIKTVPAEVASNMPKVTGGADPNPKMRQRREKVVEVIALESY